MLTTVPDPRQFGVAELDDAGQVIGLEEKPPHPKSDLALVGVYIFTPAVHEAVRQLAPSGRGELEITEALQWLIDNGHKVRSTIISGYWKDTGNVADMLEVNRMVLEGVEARSRARSTMRASSSAGWWSRPAPRSAGSRIVGPAIIGAGTRVTDSYIGPFTSVAQTAPSSTARSSTPSCFDGASDPRGRRIEASLIGHDVEVTPAPSAQGAPAGSRRSQQGADQLVLSQLTGSRIWPKLERVLLWTA